MKRFECLKRLATLVKDELVVTNVGPTRSEWEHLMPRDANLYQVGIGNVIPLSLGVALALPKRKVVALEGDGSCFMNLGSLATLAEQRPANLFITVFDNGCYESTGGQPTPTAKTADLEPVARGLGVECVKTVREVEAYAAESAAALKTDGLRVLIAKVEMGAGRKEFLADVPRSTMSGRENKYRFVRYVEKTEGVGIILPPEYSSGFSPSAGRT